ncbi:MAG: substrate-binding domain-containing protein [Kutzneria sp.]|nr:substrate-binding domain-containing protein [Kutzneria sp.]
MAVNTRSAVLAGAALAAASLLVTACNTGQIGQTGGGGVNTKQMVLITGVAAEPFYISMRCGAEAEAKAKGYQLTTQEPTQFSPSSQIPIVTGVLANKPGAVLIAPTDDKALADPMKQLKDAGIKVIEVDTKLADSSIALSTVSSDNEQGGKKAADALAKLVGGKTGSVAVLNTRAGTSTTDAREKGFAEQIKNYPNIHYIGQQYTDDQADQATSKLTALISSTPDLVGVFATNLDTGEGAVTGMRTAGKTGQIALVGFDTSPKEVDGLKNGDFQALITQDPVAIGRIGVDQADAALTGGKVTRQIPTDLVAITRDNLEQNSKYIYQTNCG